MPPVVSIVGKSKSGKTGLIVDLIQELKARGYRIATIKHTPQGAIIDTPGKNSWRHVQAGSEATAISAPDKLVIIRPTAQTLTVEEVVHFLGEDYDLILAEGFKQGNAPKIEVHRQEVGPPLTGLKKLIAIVTDEPLESKARQFSRQDTKGLVDLLEKGFVEPQRERISLYVNNAPIILTTFPRKFINNTLLAMISCLKGVGKIRSLSIFLGKVPK